MSPLLLREGLVTMLDRLGPDLLLTSTKSLHLPTLGKVLYQLTYLLFPSFSTSRLADHPGK